MTGKDHIVAVIPARYGSSRLPGKPLIDLCGMPMIRHVYERATKARFVGRVVVATDDTRILEAVRGFGGDAVMTPDLRSGSDRVAYVARTLRGARIVVNVQGDEPLIEPRMIDAAIRPLSRDETIVVGTLVRRIESPEELGNPGIVKAVLDRDGYALYFSRLPIPHNRNGQAAGAHYKHIGLYVFRRDFLLKFARFPETPLERAEKLEQLRILEHGYRIKATVTGYDSVPVDTMEDAERVRELLGRMRTQAAGLKKKRNHAPGQ